MERTSSPCSSSGCHTLRKSPIDGWDVVGSSPPRAQEVVVGVVVGEVGLAVRTPVPVDVERHEVDAVARDHLARQVLRGVGDDGDPHVPRHTTPRWDG